MKKDHFAFVASALEMIESNLQNPLSVQDVCSPFPYSSWQFQRIFRAVVGDSIGSYLRARRLTEAAQKILKDENLRILDVAVTFQFESQEAFARAFKLYFGVVPSQIKQFKGILNLKKKPQLNADKLSHIQQFFQAEPRINEWGTRHFIGVRKIIVSPLDGSQNCFELIPTLWQGFNERRKEITGRHPGYSYGIGLSKSGDMSDQDFPYLACVEVPPKTPLPDGMELLTLSPQKYIEFELKGAFHEINTAIHYLYGIWLPESAYTRVSGYDVEIINNHKPNDSYFEFTYCIPIS